MSTRKHMREMVRRQAARHGIKPSMAVRGWRRVWGAYPDFFGHKRQKKGSKQPILKYPILALRRRQKTKPDSLYGRA